jgi:hypothetical protein
MVAGRAARSPPSAGRQRLGRNGTVGRAQLQLPPADVAPGARLPADPTVDADGDEPERLVQGDAGLVGQGDPRASDLEALATEPREERLVEPPTGPAGAMPVADVDGYVHRPPVGAAGAVRAGIGKADDLSVAFGDEPRMRRLGGLDPRRQLRLVGGLLLEGRRGGFHVRGVDRRTGCGVPARLGAAERLCVQCAAHNRLPPMTEPGDIERRSIGIVFSDGGLLALSAVRPRGAEGHGEETVAAVLCGPDGAPVEVSEALLSTEYGPDGVQRRATLELWTDGEEGQPLRGAGTLISSSGIRRPGLAAEVAFFRWSLEGREGLGHYEVVRAGG